MQVGLPACLRSKLLNLRPRIRYEVIFVPYYFLDMKKISILCSCLLLAGISIAQNNSVINLTKGQKLEVTNSIKAVNTEEMMGQKVEGNADMMMLNSAEVKNLNDSGYRITNTVKRLTSKLTAMGQDMSFDSDKKEDLNSASGMKEVINVPKDFTMTRQGGLPPAKKTGGTAPDDGSNAVKLMSQQFLGSMDDAAFGLNDVFIPLPVNVKVGYRWMDSSTVSGASKAITYIVKSVTADEAVVNIDGILSTDAKMQVQGMDVISKTSGTSKGEETIDIKTHVLKHRDLTMTLTGTMEVMDQPIPVSSKIISSTTVKSL